MSSHSIIDAEFMLLPKKSCSTYLNLDLSQVSSRFSRALLSRALDSCCHRLINGTICKQGYDFSYISCEQTSCHSAIDKSKNVYKVIIPMYQGHAEQRISSRLYGEDLTVQTILQSVIPIMNLVRAISIVKRNCIPSHSHICLLHYKVANLLRGF